MSDNDLPEQQKKPTNQYLKYSGMAFQMLATILVCSYGGIKLDEYQNNETRGWTIGLSLFGIVVAMYFVIKGVMKK